LFPRNLDRHAAAQHFQQDLHATAARAHIEKGPPAIVISWPGSSSSVTSRTSCWSKCSRNAAITWLEITGIRFPKWTIVFTPGTDLTWAIDRIGTNRANK
jgi:hypothetical protein